MAVLQAILEADPSAALVAAAQTNELPFHIAAKHQTSASGVRVLQVLLQSAPAAAVALNRMAQTPLQVALESQAHVDCISLLLRAAPEAASLLDNRERRPLHTALENSAPLAMIKLLLEVAPQAATMGLQAMKVYLCRWRWIPCERGGDYITRPSCTCGHRI